MVNIDLTGKVALVTGGSRGLGREMVLAFAEHGADVIIASRKQASCEELADEVRAKHGRRALAVACNVSDWAQCDALVEAAYAEFAHIDVQVNNAGLSLLYPSLPEVSEALWDKVIGVNLKGPFRLTALVGTRMADGDGGAIVNISSVAAGPDEVHRQSVARQILRGYTPPPDGVPTEHVPTRQAAAREKFADLLVASTD